LNSISDGQSMILARISLSLKKANLITLLLLNSILLLFFSTEAFGDPD